MIYCTLFDKNYLDKGIVMIDSLKAHDSDSMIYVLCMDDFCKSVLDDYYGGAVKTISLAEFEDDELLAVKSKRSRGEYCWTCTAKLIKYVIYSLNEPMCTYVDSDLCFYSDPRVLIDEMRAEGCCVQVVSHRFLDNKEGRRRMQASGKNCVQFNTFDNSEKSLALLNDWIEKCLDDCSVENIGDQKYTDNWGDLDFVNVTDNVGAGLAPWNLHRYKFVNPEKNKVYDRYDKKEESLVFYHYQNVINLDRYTVRLNVVLENRFIDKRFISEMYVPYLNKLEAVKALIEEKYGFLPLITQYINEIGKKSSFLNSLKRNRGISFPVFCAKVYGRIINKIHRFTRKKLYIIRLDKEGK